ncbi:hypothetical protein V6N13_089865 [Hibiscus sabdariffa]|uniref:F-box/LRR-repeat protein 15/At3g58940/PEG3-like LRR domain-containing protein n=1 Tax=Hibiscus sabdariffa TaxID=183260 RepID=A0ABR2QIX5_9ROSI
MSLFQEEEDVSLQDQADQYLYQIEKSLEYLLSNKVHIRRFHLDLFKSNGNHSSRFNNILYLANKNQVDQLLLHGLENCERPILPLSLFVSVNSFRVLELKNCVLNEEILKVDPVFPCLRQMSLFHIKLPRRANHLIETLLRNCPVLEDLFVKECKLKRIHVGDHLNLRNVTILGVPVARIESKSIEFLRFEYKGHEAFNLSLVSSKKLQRLVLSATFTAREIRNIVATSPSLEILNLTPYVLLQNLKIKSPSLRELIICATGHGVAAKKININAPKLVHYQYRVDEARTTGIPAFRNPDIPRFAVLDKHLITDDHSKWFCA